MSEPETSNKTWIWYIVIGIVFVSIINLEEDKPVSKPLPYNPPSYVQNNSYNPSQNTYNTSEDDGYVWAEDNDIDNFEACQDQFGTGYEEDECNRYVKENYTGYQSFNGYECTEDCSGHEAGYDWAEDNGIEDEGDCGGNSDSFIEGCMSYVEDNY